MAMTPEQLNRAKKGATPEQSKALDYFFKVSGGCLGGKGVPDNEYDEIVKAKLNNLASKEKALNKIGMDEESVSEIPPVFFWGFEGSSVSIGDYYGSAVGADGHWRSSRASGTWLFFSNEQVFMYHIKFDMFSDSKKENTEEYFYRDITNFSTATESTEVTKVSTGKSGCGGTKETVSKKTIEYNQFSIIVPGDKFTCSASNAANVEEVIKGMKNKLREKKSAMH